MNRPRGFTLIELLLVLGVLALLIVAGFFIYKELRFRYAVAMEGRNVQTVVATVTTASAQYGSTDYLTLGASAGYSTKGMWNMNLPACQSGWCNDFGSVTKVSPAGCWITGMGAQVTNNAFEIQYSDLTRRECIGILNALGPAAPSAVRVFSPAPQWVGFCSPGTAGCSANGTRKVSALSQLPAGSGCNAQFKAPIGPEAAMDVCAEEEANRFNLLYIPARGRRL